MAAVMMMLAGGIVAALVTVGTCLLLMAPAVIRAHERPVYRHLAVRIGWRKARCTRSTDYRCGLAGTDPDGQCRLPGLLAQSTGWNAVAAAGRPFGLLHHPTTDVDRSPRGQPTGGDLISPQTVT
jgi:hypothetical protein